MTHYRSVWGNALEVQEKSSERNARLTSPGQLLYQVDPYISPPTLVEYEVIHKHEREVYLYPTKPRTTYPGKLVGWKSIVFNDGISCYFEHTSDAWDVFLQSKKSCLKRLIACVEAGKCSDQQ